MRAAAPALAAVVTAAALTALMSLPSPQTPPAMAAAPDPRVATLAVTPGAALDLGPGGEVTLQATLTTGEEGMGDATVVVQRAGDPLGPGAAGNWPAAGEPPERLVQVARTSLGPQPPRTTIPFDVTVPAAALRLPATATAAGAYGLVVEVRDVIRGIAALATTRTVVVWSPPGSGTTTLVPVVVVPTLPADPATGLVAPDQLRTAVAAGGSLRVAVAALAALPPGAGGGVVVDPALLSAATAAGGAAGAWVEDLAVACRGREVLLQAWGTPDPDLVAAAGERAAEVWGLLDAAADEVVPDFDTGGRLRIRTDIAHGAGVPGTAAATAAARAGRTAVIGTGPTGSGDVPTDGSPLRLLSPDATLLGLLGPGGGAVAIPELAAARTDGEGSVLGVLVDADDAAAMAALTQLAVGDAGGSGWLSWGTLDRWITAPAAPVAPGGGVSAAAGDPAQSPTMTQAVQQLLDTTSTVDALASALPAADDVVSAQRHLVATALASGRDAVVAVAQLLGVQAATLVQGVRIVPPSAFTLAATRASLPVTVVNDLDTQVSLTLQARSRSPRVRITEPAVPLTLAPGARLRVDLPVAAVSNGRSTVSLRLLTPATTAWGPAVDAEVRVATVAEVGAISAIAVLTSGVFAVGTWRTIRRGRRRRRTQVLT